MKTQKLSLSPTPTAHTHLLKSDQAFECQTGEDQAIHILLEAAGVVVHEEHDRIVLPAGFAHFKTNQREFNPFNQTTGLVFD